MHTLFLAPSKHTHTHIPTRADFSPRLLLTGRRGRARTSVRVCVITASIYVVCVYAVPSRAMQKCARVVLNDRTDAFEWRGVRLENASLRHKLCCQDWRLRVDAARVRLAGGWKNGYYTRVMARTALSILHSIRSVCVCCTLYSTTARQRGRRKVATASSLVARRRVCVCVCDIAAYLFTAQARMLAIWFRNARAATPDSCAVVAKDLYRNCITSLRYARTSSAGLMMDDDECRAEIFRATHNSPLYSRACAQSLLA